MTTPHVSPIHYTNDGQPVGGINWNTIPDSKDLEVWNRLTNNFWLPEKIAVSNDKPSWSQMTDDEREATLKVFTGLTALDTIQGTVGAPAIMKHAQTFHEEAVLTNIAFMESVHAKSYSNIFMTLADTPDINRAFTWAHNSPLVQDKTTRIINDYNTHGHDPLYIRALSVCLESFLFYTGFYLPLRFAAYSKLANTADIIRLIIRDEAVHGYYIGYKFQQEAKKQRGGRVDEVKDLVVELILDLYMIECDYTAEIYDPLGWTSDVEAFIRYNANKAMNNLGFDQLFPTEETKFSNVVQMSLDPGGNENHDFFSGAGSSYVIGKMEATTDEDWDF